MTLLIGADHSVKRIEAVISELKEIKNKKVMLEIHKYPFTGEFLDKDSMEFYNAVGEHIINNKGKIICGEKEECLKRTYNCLKQLETLMDKANIQGQENTKLYHGLISIAPYIERDPYFLKVIKEQQPDIVILGFTHIPFLTDFCFRKGEYKEIYIPDWAEVLAYDNYARRNEFYNSKK
ncbi:MAG: hypothetical protein ABIB71_05585 [Candidatus Woesearchaeota archaeon]